MSAAHISVEAQVERLERAQDQKQHERHLEILKQSGALRYGEQLPDDVAAELVGIRRALGFEAGKVAADIEAVRECGRLRDVQGNAEKVSNEQPDLAPVRRKIDEIASELKMLTDKATRETAELHNQIARTNGLREEAVRAKAAVDRHIAMNTRLFDFNSFDFARRHASQESGPKRARNGWRE